jgi:Arc/MetJ family transcription regulator
MRVTIEIADALICQAREAAARDGTTVRALVEEGLRDVLKRRLTRPAQFELRDASFRGNGLQPGVDQSDWASIRSEIRRASGD